MKSWLAAILCASLALDCAASPVFADKTPSPSSIRSLADSLPGPSEARGADGRPGAHYWQQFLTYRISARLDEDAARIDAEGTLDYHNASPVTLPYLLLELAPNITRPDSRLQLSMSGDLAAMSINQLAAIRYREERASGLDMLAVSIDGRPVKFEVRGTRLRIDLPMALEPKSSVSIRLEWRVKLVDVDQEGGRAGYIVLPDGERIFHVAQWYPQPVAYTDYGGWDTTPFVSAGEFAPEFGDYDVSLDIPRGMLVAGSGTLTNGKEVLTADQLARLDRASNGERQQVVSASEAARVPKFGGRATWRFSGRNIRDFAFAASRRYAWEAQRPNKNAPVAMAYYTPEAAPLWQRFALPAISHTLDVYGSRTFPYPYPVIQAAYGPIDGMEHSMLAFSRYAPDGPDGSYSAQMKRDFLWVLIHEVGHAWFPLVVNSNERQWTWMDEGLNSYLEHQTLLAWSDSYADRPNAPSQQHLIAADPLLQPPMTPANAVQSLFHSQYNRPAAALTILRETVVGPEEFDRAFKAYAQTWMFKRPNPSDFFRLMNQETGMDLDWFWRGWFFTTDQVDLSLDRVQRLEFQAVPEQGDDPAAAGVDGKDPVTAPVDQSTQVRKHPLLFDPCDSSAAISSVPRPHNSDVRQAQQALDGLSKGGFYYAVDISNHGDLTSPVPLRITYVDGRKEDLLLPVELWLRDKHHATFLIWRAKPISSIRIDPRRPTGDINAANDGGVRLVDVGLAKIPVSGKPGYYCGPAQSSRKVD